MSRGRQRKPLDAGGGARRLAVGDLGALDLSRRDPRITWARAAKASSEYSESYAAATATGRPSVFPRGGDLSGTWLAASDDPRPWLEVTFPEVERAVAVLVCETCGPGAVRLLRDAARGTVLWAGEPAHVEPSREARLLVVPLPEGAPPPARLRLEVAPYSFGSEWHELDAVALLSVSFAELLDRPAERAPVVHRRLTPGELDGVRLRDDWRLAWATGARASSEWSDGYRAKDACGAPNVFPRSGDLRGTWLAANGDRQPWLELSFPPCASSYGFVVCETCGAGAVERATDEHGAVLWEASAERELRDAHLLVVPWEERPPPRALRLWLSPEITEYRELDAVALLRAPFDDLRSPAPPEPPPPIPGQPKGGFTFVSGVLEGPSAQTPLVVATLAAPGVTLTRAGCAAELAVRDVHGAVTAVTLAETALYGAPVGRVRGRWVEVRARAPAAAQVFADAAIPDGAPVTLVARTLAEPTHVEVAGVPRVTDGGAGDAHGFRDAAAPSRPRALDLVAIATSALRETAFARDGKAGFHRLGERAARAAAPEPRHPSAGWIRGTGAAAALLVAVGAAGTALVAAGAGAMSDAGAIGGAALVGGGGLAVLFLELVGRRFTPLRFVAPTGTQRLMGAPIGKPGWTLFGMAFVIVPAMLVVALLLASGEPARTASSPALVLLALSALPTGALALARTLAWQWRALPTLARAASILTAPDATARPRGRARLVGTIADGHSLSRTDRLTEESSSHTYTTTDDKGNAVVQTSTSFWYESEVRVHRTPDLAVDGPAGLRARAGDALVSALPRAFAVGDGRGSGTAFARLERKLEEGDEVVLLGRVAAGAGGRPVFVPRLFVAGPLTDLRRHTLAALAALAALLGLVAVGVAVVAQFAITA